MIECKVQRRRVKGGITLRPCDAGIERKFSLRVECAVCDIKISMLEELLAERYSDIFSSVEYINSCPCAEFGGYYESIKENVVRCGGSELFSVEIEGEFWNYCAVYK